MEQPDLSHDKRGNEVKFLFSGGMTSLANGLASAQVVLPWVYALIGGPLYLVGLLIPTIRIGNRIAQGTWRSIVRCWVSLQSSYQARWGFWPTTSISIGR